jgi:hypothetical protein
MGFSYIGGSSNTNDAAGTTLDCAASLNVAAGDLLVCFVCNETGSSVYSVASVSGAPANAFTFDAGDAIANSVFGQMGYLLSAAADAAATFRCTWTTSRDFRRFFVMQFRPDAGATVTKDTSSDGTGIGATANSGNITTTGTDEVACGASDLFSTGATSNEQINGVAAGGVLRQVAAAMWYRVLTATFAGGAAVSTEGASDSWICGVIAFKSEPGAGPRKWFFGRTA